jgi:Ca-activated chloride channel family protein
MSKRGSLLLFAVIAALTAGGLFRPTGAYTVPVISSPTVSTTDTSGVQIQAALSQHKIVQGDSGRLFVELNIQTPQQKHSTSARKAADFVIVLDRSGSMSAQNKMPFAKAAIRDLLSRLNEEDRFALVSFDNNPLVNAELTAVDSAGRRRLQELVQGIRPGGSTNISGGLELAAGILSGTEGDRVKKVILLSDGEANHGITEPRQLAGIAASFSKQSAVLSTIGMGLGFNETLMSSLADHGMGAYGYMEHLGSLHEILAQNLEDTRNVFAQSSEIELQVEPGVQVLDAGGYPFQQVAGASNTFRVPTGQLLAGATKALVISLEVPTEDTGPKSFGALTFRFNKGAESASLKLASEQLAFSVVPQTERQAAVASINDSVVKKTWLSNNIGRMQQKLSKWIREGDEASARRVISEYGKEANTASSYSSAVNAEVMSGVLSKTKEMEALVDEAFKGAPAAQEIKRNRTAKGMYSEGRANQATTTRH